MASLRSGSGRRETVFTVLPDGCDVLRQPRFITGSSIFVQKPLIDSLVDDRNGRVQKLGALRTVTRRNGGTKLFDLGAELSAAAAVDLVTFCCLSDTLECRFMISHLIPVFDPIEINICSKTNFRLYVAVKGKSSTAAAMFNAN